MRETFSCVLVLDAGQIVWHGMLGMDKGLVWQIELLLLLEPTELQKTSVPVPLSVVVAIDCWYPE